MRFVYLYVIAPPNLHNALYVSGTRVLVASCSVTILHSYQGLFESLARRTFLEMKSVFLAFALVLLTLAPVHGIKKCEKIDACRCSTDEGEINIWSLAGQNPNGAR